MAVAIMALAAVYFIRAHEKARLVTDTAGSDFLPASMAPLVPGRDRFYAAYAGSICVKHGGLATITAIEPRDGHGGLEVTGFSVFERPSLHGIPGAVPGRLAKVVDYRGGETVTNACGKAPFREIAIEFYKPKAKDAWASDFTVHYLADGRERRTNIRLGIALCEKKGCDPNRDLAD